MTDWEKAPFLSMFLFGGMAAVLLLFLRRDMKNGVTQIPRLPGEFERKNNPGCFWIIIVGQLLLILSLSGMALDMLITGIGQAFR